MNRSPGLAGDAGASLKVPTPAARRPRLLIVDDQPFNVRALYQVFSADHQVLMATCGKQALALCASQAPDLVLLDVVMPGMDGHEVLRRLKAEAVTCDIPVIFVTGEDDAAAEAQGLALGAVDFIAKPINPAIVRARVGLHLLLKAKTDLLLRSEAEQRRLASSLNAVIDALPAHIALLDQDGLIVSVNAAWRSFALANGMRASDVGFGLGQDYAAVCDTADGVCAEGAAHTAQGIRAVLGGRMPQFALDYPCHSPDQERWYRMSVTPLGKGAADGAVVMHVEKSDRKRAELASLLEQTDALILVFDAQGRIESANPAFCRATGWTQLEAAALTAAMWPHALLTLPAQKTQQLRVQQDRRDGSNFTAVWSVSPIFDRERRLLSHVCIGRDVTLEQQIQEGLRENDKLRATALLAGAFAHDFNNLLGSVIGLTELCATEAPEGSRLAANLGRIGQASARGAALVRQLLDFSRQTPMQLQSQRASELLAHAQGLLRAALPAGIALEVTVVSDALLQIDAVQIEQCLLNLGNNAAHAMRPHGGVIRIEAELAEPLNQPGSPGAPRHLRLRVSDQGQGIAPEHLGKIFDPFFTTKPVGEGTGLGLAAVHGIVSHHGGVVEVHSTPGVGTTFSIFLPLSGSPTPTQAA